MYNIFYIYVYIYIYICTYLKMPVSKQIRRPTGSGRVEHLPFFQYYILPLFDSFFLPSFLPFFFSSNPPGGRFTSPLTPLLSLRAAALSCHAPLDLREQRLNRCTFSGGARTGAKS